MKSNIIFISAFFRCYVHCTLNACPKCFYENSIFAQYKCLSNKFLQNMSKYRWVSSRRWWHILLRIKDRFFRPLAKAIAVGWCFWHRDGCVIFHCEKKMCICIGNVKSTRFHCSKAFDSCANAIRQKVFQNSFVNFYIRHILRSLLLEPCRKLSPYSSIFFHIYVC